MLVSMQNRYTPYYKPLKISIPEPTSMISIDPEFGARFKYVPYFHFGNYYNQLNIQQSLPVNAVTQSNQKHQLKFGIDVILGLNEEKSNDSRITCCNENYQTEIGRLCSENSSQTQNNCLTRDNSSPTSSSPSYSPSFDCVRATEPEKSRFTFSPERCDSVNSWNPIKSSPVDIEKSKRVRTIFSADQMARLEEEFRRSQYMVGQERAYLAQTLNLTESQVKIWFQNRRIKWRKQNLVSQKVKLNQCQGSESRTI